MQKFFDCCASVVASEVPWGLWTLFGLICFPPHLSGVTLSAFFLWHYLKNDVFVLAVLERWVWCNIRNFVEGFIVRCYRVFSEKCNTASIWVALQTGTYWTSVGYQRWCLTSSLLFPDFQFILVVFYNTYLKSLKSFVITLCCILYGLTESEFGQMCM
jgi:hypothetical protein